MQIKSVAVLGAGAVGSYVIWGLSSRKDIRLAVIAEGPRAERLKQQGSTINGTTYRPQVWTPQEANGVDLLVVALKYGALPGALDSIAAAVGPNTTVMSLMNGVDSEEIIAAKIGAEHVLPSLIKVASHKEADGYHFNPETTIGIIYGELAAPLKSERVQAVEALLAGTGIHSRVTPYIKEEIWSKFRLNVCNNLPQAILGAGVGCYQSSAHMKAISDGLCHELEAIAVAKGIDLSKVDASSRHGSLDLESPMEFPEGYYTIKDSMAELAKNEEAFAIVAKAVKLVTNFDLKPGQGMWSMMSGMSPEHMSGMISTDLLGDKFLPSLNAQLIKIKK